MKKFYDRGREMTELKELQRQAYNDYSRFVVLTGRRRVGKTSLVYRLREFRISIVIRDIPKKALKIFAYEI